LEVHKTRGEKNCKDSAVSLSPQGSSCKIPNINVIYNSMEISNTNNHITMNTDMLMLACCESRFEPLLQCTGISTWVRTNVPARKYIISYPPPTKEVENLTVPDEAFGQLDWMQTFNATYKFLKTPGFVKEAEANFKTTLCL
jgi:hypothetical protein